MQQRRVTIVSRDSIRRGMETAKMRCNASRETSGDNVQCVLASRSGI